VEERGNESYSMGRSERWRCRVDELEGEIEDLHAKVEEQAEAIAVKDDDEKEQADEIEALRQGLEEMQ